MFASCTLSKAEKNYSNLEREALAIIFAIKHYHKFLYGRNFTLITDHQPLQIIFNPNKSLSSVTTARLIRWSIFLSAYNYTIKYKKGSSISNADALSRLPLNTSSKLLQINSFNMEDTIPISCDHIAKYTKNM